MRRSTEPLQVKNSQDSRRSLSERDKRGIHANERQQGRASDDDSVDEDPRDPRRRLHGEIRTQDQTEHAAMLNQDKPASSK